MSEGTYGRGLLIGRRKYAHRGYGGGQSSQDKGKYRMALRTMSGSYYCSQSIPAIDKKDISMECHNHTAVSGVGCLRTLFAGLSLIFSKIF